MEELIEFISKHLDLAKEDLKPETKIRDLIDDSLELIEFIIAIEAHYEIDVPDEDIDRLLTLQTIDTYING